MIVAFVFVNAHTDPEYELTEQESLVDDDRSVMRSRRHIVHERHAKSHHYERMAKERNAKAMHHHRRAAHHAKATHKAVMKAKAAAQKKKQAEKNVKREKSSKEKFAKEKAA